MKQVGIKEMVAACVQKAREAACQTETQECSNRCQRGHGTAVELTVGEYDVDFVVQQKEIEKSHSISTV